MCHHCVIVRHRDNLKISFIPSIFMVCILLCITICKNDRITITTTKTSRFIFIINLASLLPDDGPCESETCSSEARLIININLEVFVVVMVILSLLHIYTH
jgi:hypothetical protein